jgi:acyl dehydratase
MITETDNVRFTCITHNPACVHLDEQYCRGHTEFGQRIVYSAFALVVMVGISVNDTTHRTEIANLSSNEVRFPHPLFHGDTVRAQTEVLELRENESRANACVVMFLHRAWNPNDDLVPQCKRSSLHLKRPLPAE